MAFLGALTATQAITGAVATSLVAARQASAAGEYNQSISNRNAIVAEQEAEIIRNKEEYEIAQFDRKFAALQGQTTKTAY